MPALLRHRRLPRRHRAGLRPRSLCSATRGRQPPRWLVIAAGPPVALAFDAFDGHLRVPRRRDRAAAVARQLRGYARDFMRNAGPRSAHPAPAFASRRRQRSEDRSRRASSRSGRMSMFSNWTVGRRLVAGFGLAGTDAAGDRGRFLPQRLPPDRERRLGGAHPSGAHRARGSVVRNSRTPRPASAAISSPATTAISRRTNRRSADINATFDDLRKLTADNPDQQRRLAAIAPLIDSKLAELKQTIDLRRTQGIRCGRSRSCWRMPARAYMDRGARHCRRGRPGRARAS